jgi:hypothetical protein
LKNNRRCCAILLFVTSVIGIITFLEIIHIFIFLFNDLEESNKTYKLSQWVYLVADYFEVDRLVEDIARLYASQLAVSWFKVNSYKNPSKEEFRDKVIEFMDQFQFSLGKFPTTEEGIRFIEYSKKLLRKEIDIVQEGKNKEVEKRHKYYAEYS